MASKVKREQQQQYVRGWEQIQRVQQQKQQQQSSSRRCSGTTSNKSSRSKGSFTATVDIADTNQEEGNLEPGAHCHKI